MRFHFYIKMTNLSSKKKLISLYIINKFQAKIQANQTTMANSNEISDVEIKELLATIAAQKKELAKNAKELAEKEQKLAEKEQKLAEQEKLNKQLEDDIARKQLEDEISEALTSKSIIDVLKDPYYPDNIVDGWLSTNGITPSGDEIYDNFEEEAEKCLRGISFRGICEMIIAQPSGKDIKEFSPRPHEDVCWDIIEKKLKEKYFYDKKSSPKPPQQTVMLLHSEEKASSVPVLGREPTGCKFDFNYHLYGGKRCNRSNCTYVHKHNLFDFLKNPPPGSRQQTISKEVEIIFDFNYRGDEEERKKDIDLLGGGTFYFLSGDGTSITTRKVYSQYGIFVIGEKGYVMDIFKSNPDAKTKEIENSVKFSINQCVRFPTIRIIDKFVILKEK
jgi:hypothetical protein